MMNMQIREQKAMAIRLKRQEGNRKYWLLKDMGFVYDNGTWKHQVKQKMIPSIIYKKLNYNGLVNKLHTLGFTINEGTEAK